MLFTPSNSGQRSPPTSYRGCWHVVSRGLLVRYRHFKGSYSLDLSSLTTELYNPKAFFAHAASLRQGFPHCARFPTAASRRSLDRVSVPVWPVTLSGRLLIVALVGSYPANQLIRRELIPYLLFDLTSLPCDKKASCGFNPGFPRLSPCMGQIIHALLTRPPLSRTQFYSQSFILSCILSIKCLFD